MTEIQGVNSVEIAASILEVFTKHETPLRAIDIARTLKISNSRLHKYLVSLCRSNMLYQDPETNLYSLGHALTILGHIAEKQNGALTTINNALCQLRDRLNLSNGLVIKKGETLSLVRYNRSNKNIEIDFLENTTFPLTDSAAGKIFLAFADNQKQAHYLNESERKNIIKSGYAIRLTDTNGIPGAKAIACPIFNADRHLICAAVIMGFLPDSEKELNQLGVELTNAIKMIKL